MLNFCKLRKLFLFLKFPCLYLHKKESTILKGKIIHTATDLFLSYGFKSVTMDDIANKMGVSKKTIYTYFDNKINLVKETTFGLFSFISSGISRILEENHNPIEEIYIIKTFCMQNLKDEKSSPFYQLQKYYPKIHENLAKKQFDLIKNCVSENLKRGIAQELYRKEIDTDLITLFYFKGVIGIKDDETFPKNVFEMNYLMENYIDYHLRAIATKKGIQTLEKFNKKNEK